MAEGKPTTTKSDIANSKLAATNKTESQSSVAPALAATDAIDKGFTANDAKLVN